MCQTLSGVAVKSGDTVKVYTLRNNDSHEAIREEYNIRDRLHDHATPIELIPVRGMKKLDEMDLVYDAGRPDWMSDDLEREARLQMWRAWRQRWDGDTFSSGGDLYLSSLTAIPEGVTISAGGGLNLRSLTAIPEGVTLKAGSYLYLSSLTAIPEGVKVEAKRTLLKD